MKLRHLTPLLLAPFAVQAGDGVAAARQAAASVWPAAQITPLSTEAPCAGDATADAPTSARNGIAQVRVRCTGSPVWTRYIALRVEQTRPVAVLRTALAKGEALRPEAIEWQPRDVLKLPADVLLDSTALKTHGARRDLPPGSVLTQSQLTAPKTIMRGQAVMLISRAAGMEVRAPGEALADAALGARVRVRNNTSRRIVEGVAQDDGTVVVAL